MSNLDRDGVAPSRELLSSIQALRAFAAWTVVLHHYFMIFPVQHPNAFRRVFLEHGPAGVDVFFVVSGFVMALSASDPAMTPRTFIAKRLGRIVPAYWISTALIALLIVGVPEMMVGQGFSAEHFIKSLLFVPAQNPSGIGLVPTNTVGWSLNTEMMFYVIVAASLVAPRAQRWVWIAAGLVLLQKLISPTGVIGDFYRDPVLYEFLLGIAAAHLWKSGSLRGRPLPYAVLAVFAIVCITREPLPWGLMRLVDYGLPAFLLVCAFIGLEPYFARSSLLVALGNHSYSVYLIHPTVFYAGMYLHRTHGVRIPLIMVGCFAAIALIGALSYRFIERPAGRVMTRALMPR